MASFSSSSSTTAALPSLDAEANAAEDAHHVQALRSTDPLANDDNDDGDDNNDSNDDVNNNDDNYDDDENPLSESNIVKLMVERAQFVTLLQDDGKMNMKKSPPVMEYKHIRKLANALYNKFQSSKLVDLPENKNRTVKTMLSVLIQLRNHMDVHEVLPEIRAHLPSSTTNEKMYIIDNNVSGGQERFVSMCVSKFGAAKKSRQTQRNPSLAVRVVISLCHPSVRGGVVHWLTNKKIRGDLDQSYSTSLALGEEVLKLFESDDLPIKRPDFMDLSDHDPNQAITPEMCENKGRDADWILSTWKSYIQPKYKKALGKWYKQTGGGGRELQDFVKYCTLGHGSATAVWLAWVYAIDHEADFILASVSNGRPPLFITGTQEAGFDGSSSTDNGSPSDYITPRKRKADVIKEQIKESHARMDKILSIVEAQAASKAESNPIHSRLKMMGDVTSSMSTYSEDSDLTPTTKAGLLEALASEKKSLATEIIDISKKRMADKN